MKRQETPVSLAEARMEECRKAIGECGKHPFEYEGETEDYWQGALTSACMLHQALTAWEKPKKGPEKRKGSW